MLTKSLRPNISLGLLFLSPILLLFYPTTPPLWIWQILLSTITVPHASRLYQNLLIITNNILYQVQIHCLRHLWVLVGPSKSSSRGWGLMVKCLFQYSYNICRNMRIIRTSDTHFLYFIKCIFHFLHCCCITLQVEKLHHHLQWLFKWSFRG